MEERPELFISSEVIGIIKSRVEIEEYAEKNGVTLGVIYKSDRSLLVADLVEVGGRRFPYERVIPAVNGTGVVCIPVYNGRLVLQRQYRHATRSEQICFPRGFGENQLPTYETAKKLLFEVLGANARELVKIGEITPDRSLSSCTSDVYLCSLDRIESKCANGITEVLCISPDDLKIMIDGGDIVDSFTLSSIAILDAVGIDVEAFYSPMG